MQVQVYSSVNEVSSVQFANKTVVVIDVLRATSTIISALAAGASCITPVGTVVEAKAAHRPGDLLGGERFGRKITGFDLGNSPDEYCEDIVKNRRIIFTTTNGTRALHKAMRADCVLAAALLNASACAKAAAGQRKDIVLLCAGAHDQFAVEDGLCAGLLIKLIQSFSPAPIETDDLGAAMLGFYRDGASNVREVIASGVTGRKLLKMGLKKDLEACCQIDKLNAVPKLHGDCLTLEPASS